MTLTDNQRLIVISLMRRHPPGSAPLQREIDRVGYEGVFGTGRDCDAELLSAEQTQQDMADLGARLVCPGDPEWPSRLDDLGYVEREERDGVQPLALWVRGNGNLRQLSERNVSIVGSRACTDYGTFVSSDIAHDLSAEGYCVVSGAAHGIDAAAHRGALLAEGATVAVLACGVDVAYPPAHELLLQRILERGCIVSEEAPGTHPRRERFLLRNRVIAAISPMTVVVEAGRRSGALNTARHCRRLNREVLVVPGNVTSNMSEGSNELLRDGRSRIVTSARDVLEDLRPLQPMQLVLGPRSARDLLSHQCREVLDAFPARDALTVSQLAGRTGRALAWVHLQLREAVESGFVETSGDLFALTKAAKAPAGGAAT